MPITVKELRRSRSRVSGPSPSETRLYHAWGSDDPDAIEAAVAAVAPATIGALVISSYSQDTHEGSASHYDCEVSYDKAKKREPPATGDEEVTFDISTASARVKYSLETIQSYGTAPPDFKGGIAYDGEKFEGADIPFPVMTFGITHYPARATVDNAYVQNLFNTVGRTNTAKFRSFEIGEVLYLGAAGSPRNEDDYTVAHRFAAAPNITGFALGDISGIAKKGHEYLWALYQEAEDPGGFVVQIPTHVYVERMYQGADFPTNLGISA